LFQPCDQIEIMAMARRAAVRDRRAMLGLPRHSGREEEGPMDEQGLRQSGQWSRRAG